jgi:multimeric flavodoxin WrbA
MTDVDLIVFAYPVYALRAPGQVKALLDHFAVHWMVHRPKSEMFS